MDTGNSKGDWSQHDERVLCLLVASLSGAAGLSAFGGGDPLADTTAVIAALLAVMAGVMATIAGLSASRRG